VTKTEENIALTRIGRFLERLSRMILTDSVPLDLHVAKSDGDTAFGDRKKLNYSQIEVGSRWGQRWDVSWFKCTAMIPATLRDRMLAVRLDLGGEGLVYEPDGELLQGISSGSVFESDFSRDLIHLGLLPESQDQIELWIEASACGLFGVHVEADPAPNSINRYGHFEPEIRAAELCVFDHSIWSLWLDVENARGALSALSNTSAIRTRLLSGVSNTIDFFERGGSAEECRELLAACWGGSGESSIPTAVAVGHAHIDTAWLWPLSETIRKCARTFASQLRLIEQYPGYVFGASQPQHYVFIKEHYPELYDRIRSAVELGQWDVQGAMWVEADCNIISGESMIRQVLLGKNFFRDEFGVDVDNLWLPDAFGFSAALPQIMSNSGIRYFLTQKISWNQYNEFPHNSFIWRGIDGSEVLAHFPPEDTYNASLKAESLIRGAERFREKGLVDKFVSLFGVGNGGGGPKEEHIEFGLRCMDKEGVPKIEFGAASKFFKYFEQFQGDLSVWDAELYLELHRGTLTTQAQNKKMNRKLEYQLCNTEMLLSCLELTEYPAAEMARLWQILLRNQFHDILPGSSITSVYRTSSQDYDDLDTEVLGLQMSAARKLFNADENSLVVFNPTSYEYHGSIELPPEWESTTYPNNASILSQKEHGTVRALVRVPSLEMLTLTRSEEVAEDVVIDDGLVLENELVRYEFDDRAQLVSIYDKEIERRVSFPGAPGNLLSLYEDRPNDWDAWDIDRSYEACRVLTNQVIDGYERARGPVRQTLDYSMSIGSSLVKQQAVLTSGSKRLDFNTEVDWQESHRMLRVGFPVDIRSDHASFDIQYGYVRRPTHRNTSWDLARFEVVGHRYADLSEPDYGVALLNDCKYGYKVHGNTLDLCLLRSPSYPDPDADRGGHSFVYSLHPHMGDLVRSYVILAAAAINNPPMLFQGYKAGANPIPVAIRGEGVSLETLKKAEKENCLILRLVERRGCRSKVSVQFDGTLKRLEKCDLTEWHTLRGLEKDKDCDCYPLSLRPFEILTLKAWL